MDPITHALSGAIAVQCLPDNVRSRWLTVWGAVVAMSPDIDVIFCRTPLQYIEWHRGFSHSIVGLAGLAVLWALSLLWFSSLEKPSADATAARHGWNFKLAWWFSFGLLLLHSWLDCMTTYGTQIFQPFSDFRARIPGLFIIDLPLILIMGVGLIFFAKNRKVMGWLLAFIFLYPAGSAALGYGLAKRMESRLPSQIMGQTVTDVSYTTDAFAPLLWKMVVTTPESYLVAAPLTPCAPVPTTFEVYQRPSPELWQRLQAASEYFRAYARFAQFPYLESQTTLQSLPPELHTALGQPEGPFTEQVYTDLRFGSGVQFVRELQGTDDKEQEKTFRISVILDREDRVVAVRFRVVRGAGGDSGWMMADRS